MSLKTFLLKPYRKIVVLSRLIKKEIKTGPAIPFGKKLWCYRNGFFSYSYVLFNFEENNPQLYISDIEENIKSRHINQDLVYIDNKILFPLFLKPFIPVNPEYHLIMNGSLSSFNEKRSETTIEALVDAAEKGNGFMVKPVDGASGIGVFKVHFEDGTYWLNQDKKSKSEILHFVKSLHNYLVSPLIEQADYSTKIYPKSVNTVRMLTMVDPVSQKPFIAVAAHRIGNEQSFPVDNCAMGSFTANIDIETGTIGKAVTTVLHGMQNQWHSHHPDTGSPIEGVTIPNWQQIKSGILAIAENVKFLPYIGWDIVVTNDGFTIIEGNDGPDLKLHQVHGPLLTDKRVKAFYRHYKVIN